MNLLADQVCIVTGAGQGLGRAISLEMAGEGAKLALLDRNPDTLRQVVAEIADKGGTAEAYVLDVTDYDACGKAVADVIGKFGKIDTLVNNAAINPPSLTILQDTLENWRRTIAIN
ncbi:MAG TPA: SDR family NAD(P)-dependent oxidoreductase, partial [Verrucomicrobiae bacterium]|nr:SDR family NAD(P)-dependent oxidoreductase [Verrucomicrobiae bacterium]